MKKVLNILLIITSLFLISGCNNKDNKPQKEEENIGFYDVNSYLDKEDGWVFNFLIERNTEGQITSYEFDGYNLKYSHLDGYYIPVTDKETGKEIAQWEPAIVAYIYDKNRREEVIQINTYFNEKKFAKEISLLDLHDLKTNFFDKKELVYLFNEAIKQNYIRKIGKDINWGIRKSTEIDNYYWQVGILNDYGYVSRVRIDYINSKKGSLRDNIENDRIKDKTIYETIIEIEEYMLNHSIKETIEHFDYLPEIYDTLFALLNTFSGE